MIRINLIPTKAARKREGALLQLAIGGAAIFALLAVCFLMNRSVDKKIQIEKRNIAQLNAEIDKLQSVIKQVERFKKRKRELKAKIQTIDNLNKQRSGPVKLFEEFSKILPRKAWVSTYREVDKQLTLEGFCFGWSDNC